jgi:asparagine synthase (glutamine-hydrolysing)
MCGIAGYLSYKQAQNGTTSIREMTVAIAHRGPDATGFYEDENIALGHNRLSIIDLSECANQPLKDDSGRYIIVFNGEIYNYQEIKHSLKDYPFRTNGDTEVILAAYLKWGGDCLNRLAGMFAFAIWDKKERHLFIARDRLGVKPLYYYEAPNIFLFASEIKGLLASGMVPKKVNRNAVSEFLQFQSIGYPGTIIDGIRSLEAGSYMVVSDKQVTSHKYWTPWGQGPQFDFTDKVSTKHQIKQLLQQSVERRMVSDVPVAAFLSGGIDSTAVVGLMSSIAKEPVNTFTVAFEEKEFDESKYADLISKKFDTRHLQIMLKAENFLADLIPALDAMDTPTGDGVNSFVVCRAIRKNDIKVALSGTGGDELFAGYPIFGQYLKLMRLKNVWKAMKPLRALSAAMLKRGDTKRDRMHQLLTANSADIASFYPTFRQIVAPRLLAECTTLPEAANYSYLTENRGDIARFPLLSQVSIAEYLGYTQNTLLKDLDQMSMANSLEVREPFFDHDLIEFVLNIPDEQKLPHYPKQLLVESLGDLIPPEIVHRKKQGFLFPWDRWMKNELQQFCESHLDAVSKRDFIKKSGLMNAWNRFLQGDSTVRWMEIWLFVVLEYWLQKNGVE